MRRQPTSPARLVQAASAFALCLGTCLGTTFTARAADLPTLVPIPSAAYLPPVYNWTGFYIGGNIGAGWSGLSDTNTNFSDTLGSTFSASTNAQFLGGGQVGVNYEFANGIVIGAEAMLDWASNSQNAIVTATDPTGIVAANIGTSNARWLTTVSGRLGYAWDRVLLYAKGGGAWVATNAPAISVAGTLASFSRISNTGIRIHRPAQSDFHGSACGAHIRRRRHHVQQSQHFDGHRSDQLQIRQLVVVGDSLGDEWRTIWDEQKHRASLRWRK
jgi:opacity protein-like surface antigen